MATERILKPTKWFSNKSLSRLSSLGRSKSNSKSRSKSVSFNDSSSSTLSSPSPTSEHELREVFRHFDGNGDGKISPHELRSYFASTGEYLSQEEAEGVIADLDSDGDNLLDFEDFLRLMKKESGDDDGDKDEDLKKAFEMFVWEKGSECITPKGLQRMLQRLGDNKSHEECVAMIHAFDVDRNGVLDFNEFHQMMS